MMNHLLFTHKENVQLDCISEILASDAERVGKYGFPQLGQQDFTPEGIVLPINYLMSCNDRGSQWFHCFVDDSQFERYWYNLNKHESYIKQANGLICSDFSLYRDYEEDLLIRNCMRNRSLAYACQKINKKTVPTAGFGGESTWEWCFDGLPTNSSVAISTNGVLSDPEARRLFVGGLDALVHTIYPKNLIICGNYPDWIHRKYPDINIISIPSYGQMWNRRCS